MKEYIEAYEQYAITSYVKFDDPLFRPRNIPAQVLKGRKFGRNEQCPCGSGKKNKKCCQIKNECDLSEGNSA